MKRNYDIEKKKKMFCSLRVVIALFSVVRLHSTPGVTPDLFWLVRH
jgi:hypothetical protein